MLRVPVTAHPDCTNEKRQCVAGSAETGLTQELIVTTRLCRRGKDGSLGRRAAFGPLFNPPVQDICYDFS